MKKISLLLVFVLVLSIALVGCGGSDAPQGEGDADPDKVYIMRMGAAAVEPTHVAKSITEFKDAIEAKTDRIEVEVYLGNSLGSNAQMISGLQGGTVEGVVLPTPFFAPAIPEYNLLDIPGMFRSEEEYFEMLMDKSILPSLNEAIESKGMVAAGYLYPHPQITVMSKEIKSFDELKGLKIRCHDGAVKQEELKAVGAIPTIMSTADVPLALQQGTIDGMQSDVIFINGNKLYDSAKYVTNMPNYQSANVMMLSKSFLDSLPEDLRELVLDTVNEVLVEEIVPYVQQMVVRCYDMIEENGGIIVDVSDEFLQQYDEATKDVGPKYIEANPGMQAIYDEILAYINR
ncbi:MAG: TRAP transporter substrate-binding protein [Clostridiales bacterium]|jgi:TRAP-type C4-dicarboxylate transport system substrate-binding protein|nr:TRAP transporter substrate-binding protein [Clostridiales bacterium]